MLQKLYQTTCFLKNKLNYFLNFNIVEDKEAKKKVLDIIRLFLIHNFIYFQKNM